MYEVTNMTMTNNKYASFKVGRFRVQEEFGNKWSLIDDWWEEEITKSDTYEDAFKVISNYNEALEKEREKEKAAAVDVFERVVKVLEASVMMTCMAVKEINEDYKANINREYYDYFGEKKARIKMSLAKKGRFGEVIASRFVDDGCSDRAIMNRYNKLICEMEAQR